MQGRTAGTRKWQGVREKLPNVTSEQIFESKGAFHARAKALRQSSHLCGRSEVRQKVAGEELRKVTGSDSVNSCRPKPFGFYPSEVWNHCRISSRRGNKPHWLLR